MSKTLKSTVHAVINLLVVFLPLFVGTIIALFLAFYLLQPSFVMSRALEPDVIVSILFLVGGAPSIIGGIGWTYRKIRSKQTKREPVAFLACSAIILSLILGSRAAIEINHQVYVPYLDVPWIAILSFSGSLLLSSLAFCAAWLVPLPEITSKPRHIREQVVAFTGIILVSSLLYFRGFSGLRPPIYLYPGEDTYDGKPLSIILGDRITTTIPIFPDATSVSADCLRINNTDFTEHEITISGHASSSSLSLIRLFEVNITIWEESHVLFRIEHGFVRSIGAVSIPPGEWIISLTIIGVHDIEVNQTVTVHMYISIE